jgi:hypothetical protein
MKNVILTYILLLIGHFSYSQQKGYWTVFGNKKEEEFGFKNHNGKIKIQPKFRFISAVKHFDYVFIASETKDEKINVYYSTKSGKSFGKDSVYFWDNTPDCESEGFIRFRDDKAEKVGMFNRNGEVVIPAIYNELSQAKNGLVIALIDAKKKKWDEHDHLGCNHFSWTGGKTLLIDTTNKTIIENFSDSLHLDIYSHLRQKKIEETLNREHFLGIDGEIHSFVHYKKDFLLWLNSAILDKFTLENLKKSSTANLTFWKKGKGWVSKLSSTILEKNFVLIKDRLSKIQNTEQDFFISVDGLNQEIFNGKEFEIYFNNCGQPLIEKYPVMNIVISQKNGNEIIQDHFDFLKTEKGYKLISLTIRNGRLEE